MIANDNGNEVLRKAAEPVNPLFNPGPYFFKIKDLDRSSFDRDAFERLRISTPTDIFDHKNVYNIDSYQFNEITTGTSSITHNINEACADLTIGTDDGDRAVRQTRYLPYTPGKSQFIAMTGIFGQGLQEGTVRRFGLFDDRNGLFFEIDGDSISVNVRSDTSGSVVDTKYTRDTFHDPIDGTGESGIDIDFTKAQIFAFDFQWLGVGTVRFGFNIGGRSILVKQINHANDVEQVYMRTATLPLRYEIFNKQAVSSSSTLKEICITLSSEALTDPVGILFHTSNQGAIRSVGTTLTPVIAIRLKNTFNTLDNRYTAFLRSASFFTATENSFFVLSKVYKPSSITGTFTSVNTDSAVEVSTDITAYSGVSEHVIDCQTITAFNRGQLQSSGASSSDFSFLAENSLITQNYDSTNSNLFVIRAGTLDGTSDIFSSFTWYEVA